MALPILDGNQSATTLSSILTSGEHIPAHTVVSLGTQAITDMRGAVSGSVVSISNFPATQTIAGAVTANGLAVGSTVANVFPIGVDTQFSGVRTVTDLIGYRLPISLGDSNTVVSASLSDPLPAGTNRIGVVTIGNTVTIAGTVTANPTGTQTIAGTVTANLAPQANGPIIEIDSPIPNDPKYATIVGGFDTGSGETRALKLGSSGAIIVQELPAISGTVTIGSALPAGTAQIGSVTASISGTVPISISSVTVGNSVTIGSLPAISGTVTVGNSVTIGSLPAISGTVTANTFALQGTAVTTSNFTSTTASTVLANYNATREVLTIFNEGAGNLHICAGATCTTIAYQVRLSAGDYYEVPNHQTTITHSAVFATAGTARVTQVS